MSEISVAIKRARLVVMARPDRLAVHDGDEMLAALDAAAHCIRLAEHLNPTQDATDVTSMLDAMLSSDATDGERV